MVQAKTVKLAQAMLHYCARKQDWGDHDRPVTNFLEVLAEEPEFRSVFEWDLTARIVQDHVESFRSVGKVRFTPTETHTFLDTLKHDLKRNVAKHWVIIPLRGASLKETIKFGPFMFITGNEEERISILSKIGEVVPSKMKWRMDHTRKAKVPGVFDHPLLAIRITHQTDHVRFVARRWALWATAALQAIYWAYIWKDNTFYYTTVRREASQIIILAKQDWRFGHVPMGYSARCPFDLDWIKEPQHQKRFRDLFNVVISGKKDELTYRFFRGLWFFSKALSVEGQQEAFEGMGATLLYLVIALETVLLDGHGNKRAHLVRLLPRLTAMPGVSIADCEQVVDAAYSWRSEFVHAGNDVHRDYTDEFKDGDKTKKAQLLKRMVARLLTDAPNLIGRMNRRAQRKSSDPYREWRLFLTSR